MDNYNFRIVGRLYRHITLDRPTVLARVSHRAGWHSTNVHRQDKVRICPGPVTPHVHAQEIVPRKADLLVSAEF